MSTAVTLTCYALLVGAVVPYLLVRARWAHQAPTVAVLAWLGLIVSFVVSAALALNHVVLAEQQHVHSGLLGLLSACGVVAEARAGDMTPAFSDVAALLGPAIIVLLPLGWLLRTARRSRRARQRQLDMLALVGSPAAAYDATIVEHDAPAVYCLPGRACRVVVTRGALDVLSGPQLRAVLAHERAHIEGRHHLFLLVTEAFGRAFPGLPLARHARQQTPLLLEMAADDHALRFHAREELATAMCEVGPGPAPQAAMGAGGPGALIRLRRILTPQARPRRATWVGVVVASVAAPLLPLLFTCGHAV
ncbi:M56 family metallopeptidase [Streptomyces sp. LHD-70]|uniref:M56 family metallopeptidase n=1 Tax=Streptomyces sp. LHD-70 TaxID=3072140 RepID=UPI00280E8102|nr:M56 family metallopeptidase [Streptomyces sp. LHD-70]MDQ8706531.1 M56 family metallopeptidase [Streptomyces sp. LHD-70]